MSTFKTTLLIVFLALTAGVRAEMFQLTDTQNKSYLGYWAVWNADKIVGFLESIKVL